MNENMKKTKTESIRFSFGGTDYKITDHGKGRIFFSFDGNCYGMNYDAVAALIRAGLDVTNSIEGEALGTECRR